MQAFRLTLMGSTGAICDQLPDECIADLTAAGSVDVVVTYWRDQLNFIVPRDEAIEHLHGFGAWTLAELMAKTTIELSEIILWSCACGQKES